MQEIKEKLNLAIQDLYGLDFDVEVAVSPANVKADYSSNAPLKLAKELHKSPMEIAGELQEKLDAEVTAPGFLNFRLSDEYLGERIVKLADDFEQSICLDKYKGKTVICEFSDPNPFKVLHVGHLYTSVMGDSISRLFEYAGARVIRANFGGDVGLHVAKTMYILKQKPLDKLTIEDIARCYVEGTVAYEESEQARTEITELNKEIYKINAEKLHDTLVAELYWKGRELSYDYFREFYASIGLKFDKFYPESTVAGLGLEIVKEQLKRQVYEESDGAVIFDGEKYGLHTRVFINREGVPTYETKDVGLIFTKWEDYHFDKSVVITGNEQLEYMKVVLKSVEQYAPELVERTRHLTHGLVKLPGNVKMSSRKGNFLKAVEVLEMVREALKAEYDSDDEIIALAATKYAFLKYKMGGNIVFDPRESVKMTGNSGPYLLYSAVRARKILEKAGVWTEDSFHSRPRSLTPAVAGFAHFERLVSRSGHGLESEKIFSPERALAKKILEYKDILEECAAEMAPHKLANYLYELAQEFSRFYEHCPVVGDEREQERTLEVKAYLNVMTHGLNILGIEIPEEM